MRDARAHALATLALAGVTAPFAAAEPKLALVVAGELAGLFVHPDLDISRRPGWLPYSAMHRHRGVSHWPVAGTLGRAAYVVGPTVAAMLWARYPVPWGVMGLLFAGLCVADVLHVILDKLT